MSFFITFVLTTIPAGISTILLILNKKEVDAILLKYDGDYIPKHNFQDILKIFKAYRDCVFLDKRDRKILILTMLSIAVGSITIIIWVTLFLFFPHYVFGD